MQNVGNNACDDIDWSSDDEWMPDSSDMRSPAQKITLEKTKSVAPNITPAITDPSQLEHPLKGKELVKITVDRYYEHIQESKEKGLKPIPAVMCAFKEGKGYLVQALDPQEGGNYMGSLLWDNGSEVKGKLPGALPVFAHVCQQEALEKEEEVLLDPELDAMLKQVDQMDGGNSSIQLQKKKNVVSQKPESAQSFKGVQNIGSMMLSGISHPLKGTRIVEVKTESYWQSCLSYEREGYMIPEAVIVHPKWNKGYMIESINHKQNGVYMVSYETEDGVRRSMSLTADSVVYMNLNAPKRVDTEVPSIIDASEAAEEECMRKTPGLWKRFKMKIISTCSTAQKEIRPVGREVKHTIVEEAKAQKRSMKQQIAYNWQEFKRNHLKQDQMFF